MEACKTFLEGAVNAARTHSGALAISPFDSRKRDRDRADAERDYDIAIIGLGPAGATLARLLDPRFRVIAIDKKTLEPSDPIAVSSNDTAVAAPSDLPSASSRAFRKPCGGLLSPDAQRSLAAFDITLPADILVSPQIFSVRVVDLPHDITRYYQRCYVNMDRHRFDQWLIGLIPETVHMELGATVSSVRARNDVSARAEGFAITYVDAHGMPKTVTSRIVVGAEGAFSHVRRLMYPNEKRHVYTSIQQWFKDANPSPFYSCIFDPEVTDCCSWTISKDGYFIFGGAYPRKAAREAFENQKARLAERGFCFGEPLRTEACEVVRPAAPSDFKCGRNGAFLVGEAAGFISASSLEGISFAFDSARALADVLNRCGCDASANRRYARATAGLRSKALAKIAKSRIIDSPHLRGLIMRFGIGTIKMASKS